MFLERDRDRKVGQAVEKIQGPVERVDDPALGGIRIAARALFFHQKTDLRMAVGELLEKRSFHLQVGGRDKIRRPLVGNLELFHLAKVAHQRPGGAESGLGHDVDDRRAA